MSRAPRRPSRLPPSPVCLGGERGKAVAYLGTVERALALDHWTRSERVELIRRWKLWKLRAAGLDGYFDTYGTFGRMPGSPAPTGRDVVEREWKQRTKRTTQHIGAATLWISSQS
jgi:hypothetical protein